MCFWLCHHLFKQFLSDRKENLVDTLEFRGSKVFIVGTLTISVLTVLSTNEVRIPIFAQGSAHTSYFKYGY